jgi:hypothetical protein
MSKDNDIVCSIVYYVQNNDLDVSGIGTVLITTCSARNYLKGMSNYTKENC